MKKQNIVILGVIAVIVIVTTYFFLNREKDRQNLTNQHSVKPLLGAQSEWKTYENTAYHFKVKYPQTGSAGKVSEADPTPDEKSPEIEINIPGGQQHVHIKTSDPNRGLGVGKKQSITPEIKSFAETARQKEISDKNPNFPNKKVVELKETVFVNKKAFLYVVTGSPDGYGNNDNNYIFLEYGE